MVTVLSIREMTRSCLVAATTAVLCLSGDVFGQGEPNTNSAATLFEKQCYSCHNIGGGDKTGPDLSGVTNRRKRDWIHRFILSPKSMKDSGDATAVQLLKKFAPEVMPDQMLSPDQIDQILGLVEQLAAQGKTFVPQSGKLTRPPAPKDIPAGRQLFTGQRSFAKGGPPCISCHSVDQVACFGGGSLGPDLTNVNMKYSDVELASILKSPAFPTMTKLFESRQLTDEEVVQVFAYLQSVRDRTPDNRRDGFQFLGVAAAGTLALLGLMSFTWRGRLRGVRRFLKEGTK